MWRKFPRLIATGQQANKHKSGLVRLAEINLNKRTLKTYAFSPQTPAMLLSETKLRNRDLYDQGHRAG